MKAFRIVLLCVVPSLGLAVPARAQSDRGIVVAGHLATLNLSDVNGTNTGFGGRITIDVTRWLAIDGEVTYFPTDDLVVPLTTAPTASAFEGSGLLYRRERTEGFVGVKVGYRGSRLGVFGKARPGFTRLVDKGLRCSGEVCALILVMRPEYQPEFAFDLGGVLEFYPSSRIVARFDVGDVIIRNRSFGVPFTNGTTHNLTSRLGVGFRF